MWVHAREIGNKKKKKKEERRKKKEERRRQSVGSTNFDIFTIGRKKNRFFKFGTAVKKISHVYF